MYGNILQAIARIKRNVAEFLTAESIDEVCREVGHAWRERQLGPAKTVWAFLLQVLHGNTSCAHTVRLANLHCSAEAYCEARARLPLAALESLLERVTRVVRRSCGPPLWRGHRTFLVDGTGVSMPDTPELQDHFGQPGQQRKGCGFPQAHLVAMFDAATGLLVKMLAAPLRTHDQSQVALLHPELAAGDVLVGDRGFASYVHLALILGRELHAVFRVHQRQLVSFRLDRRLSGPLPRGTIARKATGCLLKKFGRFDQIVQYAKPPQCPTWMDTATFQALPDTIIVRELRYRTGVRGLRSARDHSGYYPPRSDSVPSRRTGRVVSPALGCRNQPRSSENDHENGRAALPIRGGCQSRTDDVRAGLQPDPADHDRSSPPTTATHQAIELRRCATLAQLRRLPIPVVRIASDLSPALSYRTSRTQTPT